MLKKIPLKGVFYLSLGINVLVMAVIFLSRDFLPPVVPLLYGLPYGEGQLVPTLGLYSIPGGALTLTIINLAFAINLKDHFYKRTLVVTSAFISILGAVTVVKIILLVGLF